MAQLTGIIFIHVNGKLLAAKDGAKLNTGGMERTAQTGNARVLGYTEKLVPSEVECTIGHDADTDIAELNGITGAVVDFECDTGTRYLVTNAFTAEPVVLTGGDGELSLKMTGDPALEQ